MADPEIFVSYSRQHERLVTPLVKLLRVGDRVVFQDVVSIDLGAKWDDTILASIERASTVIIIWCRHASMSKWVRKEAAAAVAGEKAIIPVLIDRTPLPDYLGAYQGVDLSRHIRHGDAWTMKPLIIDICIALLILIIGLVCLLPSILEQRRRASQAGAAFNLAGLGKSLADYINRPYGPDGGLDHFPYPTPFRFPFMVPFADPLLPEIEASIRESWGRLRAGDVTPGRLLSLSWASLRWMVLRSEEIRAAERSEEWERAWASDLKATADEEFARAKHRLAAEEAAARAKVRSAIAWVAIPSGLLVLGAISLLMSRVRDETRQGRRLSESVMERLRAVT